MRILRLKCLFMSYVSLMVMDAQSNCWSADQMGYVTHWEYFQRKNRGM